MRAGDIVVYNGETESLDNYDNPRILGIYKAYEVSSVYVHSWSTDVKLKGVEGTFNSVWFTPATPRREFKFRVEKYGKAKFIFDGQSVFDEKDRRLGTIYELAHMAANNKYTIDFKTMVVKKVWLKCTEFSASLIRNFLGKVVELTLPLFQYV